MTVDNQVINTISQKATAFEEDFENDYLEVVDASIVFDYIEDGTMPQYRVHVFIEDEYSFEKEPTYTYPVVEFGKELDLFLFDTVTHWEDNQVELRFGYEP